MCGKRQRSAPACVCFSCCLGNPASRPCAGWAATLARTLCKSSRIARVLHLTAFIFREISLEQIALQIWSAGSVPATFVEADKAAAP